MSSVQKELVSKFNEFIVKLETMESQLATEIRETQEKRKEYEELIQSSKSAKETNDRLTSELEQKLSAASNRLTHVEAREKKLDADEKQLKKERDGLIEIQDRNDKRENELNDRDNEIKSRAVLQEMEDRRLQLWEKRLKLMSQDEKTKKELANLK